MSKSSPDSSDIYLDGHLLWSASALYVDMDSLIEISDDHSQMIVMSQGATGTAFDFCDGRIGTMALVINDKETYRLYSLPACGNTKVLWKGDAVHFIGSSDGKHRDEVFIFEGGNFKPDQGSKAKSTDISVEKLSIPAGFGSGSKAGWGSSNKRVDRRTDERSPSASQEMVQRHPESVLRVIRANIGGIKDVYDKYLKIHPNMGGRITVKFKINPSGNVDAIDVIESTTGVQMMDEEIKDKARMMKFEQVESGYSVINYTFNFSKN
jgi:TonB family protein